MAPVVPASSPPLPLTSGPFEVSSSARMIVEGVPLAGELLKFPLLRLDPDHARRAGLSRPVKWQFFYHPYTTNAAQVSWGRRRQAPK